MRCPYHDLQSWVFDSFIVWTKFSSNVAIAFLSQTIETCQRIYHNIVWRIMLRAFGYRAAMSCDMLGVVGSNLTISNLANNTQYRNAMAKRTKHVAPNNVAIRCGDISRSFGRGFTPKTVLYSIVVNNDRHNTE